MKKINNVAYWTLKKLLKLRELILRYILDTKLTYLVVGIIIGITFTIIFLNIPKEDKRIIQIAKASAITSTSGWDTGLDENSKADTVSAGISEDGIEGLVKKHFGSLSDKMIEIAKCESNLESDRIGDTHITFIQDGQTYGMSCGLFQIRTLPGRLTCNEMLDAEDNIKMAKKIYDRQGFGAWRNCSIKLGFLK